MFASPARYRTILVIMVLAFAAGYPGSWPSAASQGETYEVRSGDTLFSIAGATGASVPDLVALNNITDPSLIVIGQRLRLPGPAGPRESTRQPTRESRFLAYEVQSGDTLVQIAVRFRVSPADVIEHNRLADPDRIVVGQLLEIPQHAGAGSSGNRAPATSTPAPARPAVRTNSTHAPAPTPAVLAVTAIATPSVSVDPRVTATPRPPLLSHTPVFGVQWLGVPSYWPGRPDGDPIALVIHVAGGSLEGMYHWFIKPDNLSSAHYGIGLDGRIHQYVDLGDRAWTNGYTEPGNLWPGPPNANPNDWTVSIEMEDLGARYYQVPDAQFRGAVLVGREVRARFPNLRYLISHRAIAPETRAYDPGPSWIESGYFHALARELGLTPIP
jgi:LysM repeat protein